MPTDPSRPASWKGNESTPAAGFRRPGQGAKYSWKSDAAAFEPPSGRRFKAGFFSVLGIAVVAGLAWVIYQLLPTRPICVTVIAADPRSVADDLSLPLNIYGHRDGRDFLAWANSGDRAARRWCSRLGAKAEPWPVSTGRREDDWLKLLADTKEDGIVIYLSQPGGTDERGKPFVFDERGGKLDIANLLVNLKPIAKRKLLILDATHSPTDWRQGVLVNDFATGLMALAPEIAADPTLLVLCSSSPGQRSWVSEEFGQSVFAHFLIEGLKGGAIDGRAGPITAVELLPYVRKKVNDWVQSNRADNNVPFRQEPFLLPAGAENDKRASRFTLAYGDPNYEPVLTPPRRELRTDELKKSWDLCDQLAAKTPGPWVYSPRGWRRLREMLLRYETALRAGDDETAAKLLGSSARLAALVDAERTVKATEALSAGLSMPAALGKELTIAEPKLASMLDGKENLGAAIKKDFAGEDTLPRLQLIGYMLKRAVERPDRFVEIIGRVQELDEGGATRPIEAHVPVMLAKFPNLPGGERPAPQLLALATSCRRSAEEAALNISAAPAHPYSERLSRALAENVIQTDRDRRRGEDLLFCAVQPHHSEAQKLLTTAKSKYELIKSKAAPARQACEIRDRVFADLPFLTEWAALSVTSLSEAQQRQPENIWKNAHALADRVAQLDPLNESAPGNEPADKDLTGLADTVATEFRELQKAYRNVVSSLIDGPESATQSFHQRIENCLAVAGPTVSAAERAKLVNRSREIGFKLAQGSLPTPSAQAVSERELAVLVPRYARAILGRQVMDGLSDSDLKKSFELIDDASLGRQLAGHWKKLRNETDRANRDDTDKSPVPLPWRERLGLLAGTAVEHPREPAQVARDERWRLAFRRMAVRSELDHWYDGSRPYSESLSRKFLKALPELESARLLKELGDRSRLGLFRIQQPPERILTTQRDFPAIFQITGIDKHFEPGQAALAGRLTAESLTFATPQAPHPVSVDRDREEKVQLTAPRPLDSLRDPQPVDLALVGYYRGQLVTSAVARMPIRPIPDLTVARPQPPNTAKISARADDDLDLGAIAIVFDCSGSMNETFQDKLTNAEVRKFDAAKKALAQFESELPQGALVSLWAYSHKGSPKDNIQQLLPLTRWDRTNPSKAKLLTQTLAPLEPESVTPLIATMKRAVDDPAFIAAPGFKTLLVLTDGCNQLTREPPTKQENEQYAAEFRTAFVDVDRKVSVRMALFSLGKDKAAADVQFKDIDKIVTPSSKVEAESAQELSDLLSSSLRPRVALYSNNVQVANASFIAKRRSEALEWFPDPALEEFGEFEVRCRDAGQRIKLEPGDRLALWIRKGPTGLRLQRLLMADDPERSKLRVLDGLTDDAPFALGLKDGRTIQNDTNVRGKFTLEDRRAARGENEIVRLDRPKWIWWEFKGIGRDDIPSQSKVIALYESQAPIWELSSSAWPLQGGGGNRLKPMVEVWATSSNPEAADVRELPANEKLANVAIDNNTALLESAGFERTNMLMNDGSLRELDCLVVRLRSSVGGKYYVQVAGSPAMAESHRYFNDARSSTHAFWLREDAKSMPLRLNLINVDAAKLNCTKLRKEPVDE